MQIYHYCNQIESSFKHVSIILSNCNILIPKNDLCRKMSHSYKIRTDFRFVRKKIHPEVFHDILNHSLQLAFPVKIQFNVQSNVKRHKSGLPTPVINFFNLLQKLEVNMKEIIETCKAINGIIGRFSDFTENKVLLSLGVYHLLRSQGRFNPEIALNHIGNTDRARVTTPPVSDDERDTAALINMPETVTAPPTENTFDATTDLTTTDTAFNNITIESATITATDAEIDQRLTADSVCPCIDYSMSEMKHTLAEIPLSSNETPPTEVSTLSHVEVANILASLTY
jgi:hypothetical protein